MAQIFNTTYAYFTGSVVIGTTSSTVSDNSVAVGYKNVINSEYSMAIGANNEVNGKSSLVTGLNSHADGEYSHAEGSSTATGNYSHSEGQNTKAIGNYSHAEGQNSEAQVDYSHAEGYNTTAKGKYSHTEGRETLAQGAYSHAEGIGSNNNWVSTGAFGTASHVEGYETTATGGYSHAEGNSTKSSGSNSHAEGYKAEASGDNSHAEGTTTKASGSNSHAEGNSTKSSGIASHAEGYSTESIGDYSHAEGYDTISNSAYSHAEGQYTISSGTSAHAEGIGLNISIYASNSNRRDNYIVVDTSYLSYEAAQETTITYPYFTYNQYDYITFKYVSSAREYFTQTEIDNATSVDDLAYNKTTSDIKKYENYKYVTIYVPGYNVCNETECKYIYNENTAIAALSTEDRAIYDNCIAHKVPGTSNLNVNNPGTTYCIINNWPHTKYVYNKSVNVTNVIENTSKHTLTLQLSDWINELWAVNNDLIYVRASSAIGNSSHAEGIKTKAVAEASHAEGYETIAYEKYSHAEGANSEARGMYSHTEGYKTTTLGAYSHAEGSNTQSIGDYSHSEGNETVSQGIYSHAEGYKTLAYENAHAEGNESIALGTYSHAEGNQTQANSITSHAEGTQTVAEGDYSHAEGYKTSANGVYSHVEGYQTEAGEGSHAEGYQTYANAQYSHSEGYNNIIYDWDTTDGEHKYNGNYSHVEGAYNEIKNQYEHASGRYNVSRSYYPSGDPNAGIWGPYKESTLFTIGAGTSETERKNAFEVRQTGDVIISGSLTMDGDLSLGKGEFSDLTNSQIDEYISYADNNAELAGCNNIVVNDVKFISDVHLSKKGELSYNVGKITYATGADGGTENKGVISVDTTTLTGVESKTKLGLTIEDGIIKLSKIINIVISISGSQVLRPNATSLTFTLTANNYTKPTPIVNITSSIGTLYSSADALLSTTSDTDKAKLVVTNYTNITHAIDPNTTTKTTHTVYFNELSLTGAASRQTISISAGSTIDNDAEHDNVDTISGTINIGFKYPILYSNTNSFETSSSCCGWCERDAILYDSTIDNYFTSYYPSAFYNGLDSIYVALYISDTNSSKLLKFTLGPTNNTSSAFIDTIPLFGVTYRIYKLNVNSSSTNAIKITGIV